MKYLNVPSFYSVDKYFMCKDDQIILFYKLFVVFYTEKLCIFVYL